MCPVCPVDAGHHRWMNVSKEFPQICLMHMFLDIWMYLNVFELYSIALNDIHLYSIIFNCIHVEKVWNVWKVKGLATFTGPGLTEHSLFTTASSTFQTTKRYDDWKEHNMIGQDAPSMLLLCCAPSTFGCASPRYSAESEKCNWMFSPLFPNKNNVDNVQNVLTCIKMRPMQMTSNQSKIIWYINSNYVSTMCVYVCDLQGSETGEFLDHLQLQYYYVSSTLVDIHGYSWISYDFFTRSLLKPF